MANHAILSASSCKRWLNCPPSARLCASTPERASPFAKEGTDAHTLCEYKVLCALGRSNIRDPTEDLDFYNAEMEDCATEYCNYVMEQYEEAKVHCKDPQIMIEEHLDFSRWVPDGFGTGDCIIVSDEVLQIIDFKYGFGVVVDAEMNPQMMCYALGAIDLYDGIYNIHTVKMTIFQPRRDNISTFTISKEDLLKWAEEVLAPTAALAYLGEGEFQAGDHCQFCSVKATCRKRAEQNLELARYDFEMPPNLNHTEITAILSKADELVSWVNDVKEYALKQALDGVRYDGYKLVEGRSNRRFSDEDRVATIVKDAGFDPYEQKLLSVRAMTTLLGKTKFQELLDEYVTKPEGKPALVPDTDARPEFHTAKNDFNEY